MMECIKKIIPSVVQELEKRQPQQEEQMNRFWKNVLNGKAAKHIKIYGSNQDIVKVFVDSPAWLFQLNLHKRKILKELKEQFPDIKDVCFKLGKVA